MAAKDVVSARDHEEDPNEALYLPYLFRDRLYVVSLGEVVVKGQRSELSPSDFERSKAVRLLTMAIFRWES